MVGMGRVEVELLIQTLCGGQRPSAWGVPRFDGKQFKFDRPDLTISPLQVDKDSKKQQLAAAVSAVDPRFYVPANMWQSINNAMDAVKDDYDVWWGAVEIPPGIHTLADEILLTGENAWLIGFGSVSSEGVGGGGGAYGSGGGVTQLVAPAVAGKRGIVYYSGSNIFAGPTIENIHVVGNSTAAGGFNIRKSNDYRLYNCASGLFSNGYDFWFEGAGSISQYGYMERLVCYGSKYGIKLSEVSGMRFVACLLSGNRNAAYTTQAGSKGIWGTIPDNGSNIFLGTILQGYDQLIDFESDENSMFIGTRLEDWITGAIKLSKTSGGRNKGFQLLGASINNFLGGGVGTLVDVGAGVENSLIVFSNADGFTNLYVDNSGNETNKRWINGELHASTIVLTGAILQKDGITAPPTASGFMWQYVDAADGDLKAKFGDGFVRVIGADS